jgi:septum formation protein
MKQIVLASVSPRRKEIFKKLGLKFRIAKSNFPEKKIREKNPLKIAKYFSRQKAHRVAARCKNCLVISADTVVFCHGKVLGKPSTKKQAIEMLKFLSGKAHYVITGFTVIDGDRNLEITKAVKTKVYFRKLSEKEIKHYVDSGEPMDKAGAYAIQGKGALFVKKIVGDYFNVVGLPLCELYGVLKKFGMEL